MCVSLCVYVCLCVYSPNARRRRSLLITLVAVVADVQVVLVVVVEVIEERMQVVVSDARE